MEKKKHHLAKLALAAFTCALSLSSDVQATDGKEMDVVGTILAAHCGAKCGGARKNEISYNDSSSGTDAYSNNSYQSGSSYGNPTSTYGGLNSRSNPNPGTTGYSDSSSYSNPSSSNAYSHPTYGGSTYGTSGSRSSPSTRSDSATSSWNTNAYRGGSADWNPNRSYDNGMNYNENSNDRNMNQTSNANTRGNRR